MTDLIDFNLDDLEKSKDIIQLPSLQGGDIPKQATISWESAAMDTAAEAEENDTWHQVKGYGASAVVEMGGGLYMSHKLNSAGRYNRTVANSKKIINSLRALRTANLATWQKSFTPWGAVAQVGGFVVTEAGIWALSNLAGQGTRNLMGVQEGIHASELISSAVFGTIAQPVESAFQFAKIGDKINKAMPIKVVAETTKNAKSGVIDMAAWKGRELLVKGTPKFISGAALGLAESTMRQELALQMNDIEERNKWDYMLSTLAGGSINSVFGVMSQSGAWGRKQATTVSERARDRTKQAIEDIDADLSKIKDKTQDIATNTRYNELLVKKQQHEQSLEVIEDIVDHTKKADEFLSVDETNPSKPADQPEPEVLKEKRELLENQNKLDSTEPKEVINVDKALDESTLDRLLQQLEEKWQLAVKNLDEGSVTDDIIRTTRKIYEAADYDMGIAIEKLALMGDDIDMPTITRLLEDVETQIKLLDGVHGRLNTAAGRAIRANNLNSSPSPNTTYSVANEATKDALNTIRSRLRGLIDGTDTTDEFLDSIDNLIKGKKPKNKAVDVDETGTLPKEEPEVDTPTAPKDSPEGDIPPTPKNKDEGSDSGAKPDVDESEASPVVSALDKRIAKLQKQLDELLPNISGKKPEEPKGKKGSKKTEDPEIQRLKKNIANAKKYKREAEKVVELELEVARLAKIAARNDPAEMQAELITKTKKPKEELNKRINAAKERQRAAKKLFRDRLKKIAEEERKQIRLESKAKLWDDVYDYVYREAELENTSVGVKLFRTARILRKLGMVNSPTSAMAAIPTGLFEMTKLFPKALVSYGRGVVKGDALERQIAGFELEAAGEAMLTLLSPQTWKHFRKAQKTGQDPNFMSTTRFGDEFQTSSARALNPLGMDMVVTNAREAAKRAAYGQDVTIAWANEKLALGKIMPFLSFGARTIIGVDATFKRQLRFAAARLESRKKGVLNHPNDPVKAREYSDKLLESWQRDANGLKVLGQVDELADDFARIDDALLMASHGDVQDVASNLTEEILIKPISRLLNNDKDTKAMYAGAIVELFMPFYKVGVRSVVKSATLANPLRVLEATKQGNPYTKIAEDLNKLKEEAALVLENQRKSRGKAWIQNQQKKILDYDKRLRLVEVRKIKHNKEVLTDVLIQLSLGSTAFAAGYMGKATGTNAWLTADQKKKNKDKIKDFTMFGMDYRAAVPVNLLMAFAADLGRYMRAEKEGQLSEELSPITLMLESLKTASRELPTSQGLADIEGLFSGQEERVEAIILKVAASYAIPVPSWIRKGTSFITNKDSISELRGAKWDDRLWYYTFGNATPSRKVDLIGEIVENDKTIHHTWNRFATPKETKREPYQEIIASDHNKVLDAELPSGFVTKENMYEWLDEDGVTLHQHFAKLLRKSGLREELNAYAKGQFKTTGKIGERSDKGEVQRKGFLDFRKIMNKHYKRVRDQMENNPRLLKRFVNRENKNLYKEVLNLRTQGDTVILKDLPKSIY